MCGGLGFRSKGLGGDRALVVPLGLLLLEVVSHGVGT